MAPMICMTAGLSSLLMSACSFLSQTLKAEVQYQTQKHQQKNKCATLPLVAQSPFTN